jgi:hypothetical protein
LLNILIVGNQIVNLTTKHSFDHYNLCFKSSNGKCNPTLDIYISNIFNGSKRTQFGQGLLPKPCSKNLEYHKIPIAKKRIHLQVSGLAFTHLWKCVWILRDFIGPLFLECLNLGLGSRSYVMTLVTLKKIFRMTYWTFQWEVIWSLKLSFLKLGVISIVWLLSFHMFITIITYFHFWNLISLYENIFQDLSNGQKWVEFGQSFILKPWNVFQNFETLGKF